MPKHPSDLRSLATRHLSRVARLLAIAATALTAGCSHYQLGTDAKLPFRTLYVAPVTNQTLLPQAREIVTAHLRETLARDGRITLVNSPEAADATLTVVLTDYHREIATVREGDTGLARKFNLNLGATCTLSDRRSGSAAGGARNFFEHRAVSAQRESFTDGGQLQSEYQALPLLADSLANKVTHLLLDVW